MGGTHALDIVSRAYWPTLVTLVRFLEIDPGSAGPVRFVVNQLDAKDGCAVAVPNRTQLATQQRWGGKIKEPVVGGIQELFGQKDQTTQDFVHHEDWSVVESPMESFAEFSRAVYMEEDEETHASTSYVPLPTSVCTLTAGRVVTPLLLDEPTRLCSLPFLALGASAFGVSLSEQTRVISFAPTADDGGSKKRLCAEEDFFEPRKRVVTFSDDVLVIPSSSSAMNDDGIGS